MGNWLDDFQTPPNQGDQQGFNAPNPNYQGYGVQNQGYGMPNQGIPYPQQGDYGLGAGQPYNPGYGYAQAPVGTVDRYGNVKYTRMQYVEGLRAYVMNATKMAIMTEERLDECPDILRHACAPAKISYLKMNEFYVPETGVRIPFYFCMSCGKLFYAKEFM